MENKKVIRDTSEQLKLYCNSYRYVSNSHCKRGEKKFSETRYKRRPYSESDVNETLSVVHIFVI